MEKKRSQYTPRSEGMANVLQTTKRLLATKSPKDITLREVASESGHAPRLIILWFGGKGGLYAAVCESIFGDLAESGEFYFGNIVLRPDVAIAFQVLNYMQTMHPEDTKRLRKGSIQEIMSSRLQERLGKTPDEASVIARRLSAVALGTVLFRDLLGLTDDDIIGMLRSEFAATTGIMLPEKSNRSES